MTTEKIVEVTEVKKGSKWEVSLVIDDQQEVYKRLTNDLIAKKLNKATYIKSIKRTPLYNGFQKITVYYDNGVKSTYIVENR